MAAPAKTIHTFKPADAEGASPAPRERNIVRHNFDDARDDRRRHLNVSEKLAEGRGFWRGAFVGAAIGAAGGMAGSVGVAEMWTKQVLETVQQSVIVAQTLGGVAAADAISTVHHQDTDSAPLPGAGSGDAR
jgi:hypothetical protein